MNDIAKTNCKTRLEKAIQAEGLSNVTVGRILGINANYLSMMKNPDTWSKCPNAAWEAVCNWINSGQGLMEYSEKHGHVLPEKHEPKPGTVISKVIKTEPIKKSEIKKVVTEPPQRATRGQLIDMLIEEKTLLKTKIDAIDLLLKHYISE